MKRLSGLIVALVLTYVTAHAATLGVPGEGATLSGVSLISGWKCEVVGALTIRFFDNDGTPVIINGEDTFPLPHGSFRPDTEGVCDDVHNGFSSTWNWGEMADGQYTAVVYEDGVEFDRNTFTVVTFGENFVEGASGTCEISDFPAPGETARFKWNQSTQHLELEAVRETSTPEPPTPTPSSQGKLYWAQWVGNIPNYDGPVGGHKYIVERANLDGSQHETAFSLPHWPYHLTIDPIQDKLYWVRYERESEAFIERANLDGSQRETLISIGRHYPYDFALDPLEGKMYWSIPTSQTLNSRDIRRANLDGTQRETVVSLPHWLRYVAIDSIGGKLYWMTAAPSWTASNDEYVINRANTDGSQIEDVFIRPDEPKELAVDSIQGKLYWIESDSGKLQRANLDGSQVETLYDTGVHWLSDLALDLSGGKLYWSEDIGAGLYRANLNGTQRETLVAGRRIVQFSLAVK